MNGLGISNRLGHLGMDWYGFYSQAALWKACWRVSFRGDTRSYRFAPVCSDKLAFYVLGDIMGEIGLLLAGLDRKPDVIGVGRGWYGGTNVRKAMDQERHHFLLRCDRRREAAGGSTKQ